LYSFFKSRSFYERGVDTDYRQRLKTLNGKETTAMRNLLFALIYLVTINGFALQSVLADSKTAISIQETAISIQDADSVDDAVAHIIEIPEGQAFDIVLVVNHAASASVGQELRPTQVIFARQSRIFERLTLKHSDTIGIDLPLKYLVWEDRDGEVNITWNDPFFKQGGGS
jgi:uncharacterized protein (DUF302 family)